MRRAKLRALTLVGVLVATMLIGAVGAHATSTRATKGDAQAVFNASQTGGSAILLHSGKVVVRLRIV